MVNYLEYEQEARRQRVKEWYKSKKDDLTDETKNAPLRELTYERRKQVMSNKGMVRIASVPDPESIFWVNYLDTYIHKYNVDLGKDITLEEAVNSI